MRVNPGFRRTLQEAAGIVCNLRHVREGEDRLSVRMNHYPVDQAASLRFFLDVLAIQVRNCRIIQHPFIEVRSRTAAGDEQDDRPARKDGAARILKGFNGPAKEYPEHMPLMGYYDEGNPEVCVREIKRAASTASIASSTAGTATLSNCFACTFYADYLSFRTFLRGLT